MPAPDSGMARTARGRGWNSMEEGMKRELWVIVERVAVAACSASVKGSGGGMLLLMESPERSFCHLPPTQISDVAVVLLYS